MGYPSFVSGCSGQHGACWRKVSPVLICHITLRTAAHNGSMGGRKNRHQGKQSGSEPTITDKPRQSRRRTGLSHPITRVIDLG
jgi:hypothetical protein